MTHASAVPAREDRRPLGLALMAAAVLCFTCIDASAKWLILSGLPALQVVFARYAGHFALSLVAFVPTEGAGAFRSRRPWLQLLRSAFLLASTVLNFMALTYLPITLTTTIMFAGRSSCRCSASPSSASAWGCGGWRPSSWASSA